jgi:VCBS repeat-containing protein
MKWLKYLSLLLVASALAACGPEDETGNNDNNGNNGTSSFAVTANDQNVTENPSEVTVASVDNDETDTFIVIHKDDDGAPGEVIGNSDLLEASADPITDVTVELSEPATDGQTLWAMLHVDDPMDGNYTFDGANGEDVPAMVDGEIVMDSFTVTVDDETVTPAITVEDQTLSADSADTVNVPSATLDAQGWVVIHADDGGSPGEVLGNSSVLSEGETTDVEVTLDRDAEDGETLYAMLHYDDPADGTYNFPDEDPPVSVDGDVVVEPFEITIEDSGPTPSVTVENLTLPTGADTVTIPEAVIDADGWLVIHEDDGGNPGAVLGNSELLEPGTTENVEVTLNRAVVDGETLHAMLHYDDPADGTYNFPTDNEDPPVEVDGDVVVEPFDITVDSSPMVMASDQLIAAAGDTVMVDSVSYDMDGWVVIHADDNGSPGAVLGHSALLAGADSPHSDVQVTLDTPITSDQTLWAMLHEDDGNGTYDFGTSGGTTDVPVEDGGDIVMQSFEATLPMVNASDITLNGSNGDLSTMVTVDGARSKGPGWLVVHANACSNFGDVLGQAELTDGMNSDLEIALSRPAADMGSNADLCAMLHVDNGTAGEYEFGDGSGNDGPVMNADGDVIMQTFNVSVTDGTPAIRITLSSNGASDYTVDSVEPARFDTNAAGSGTLSGLNDPEMVFFSGWRYEIVNTVSNPHPFEFRNSDGDRLLSQDAGGSSNAGDFEGVASINWDDPSNENYIRFTVSDVFENGDDGGLLGLGNIPGIDTYICQIHSSMTGSVSYQSN